MVEITVPRPPRATGQPDVDAGNMVNWAWDVFRVFELENAFLKAVDQSVSGEFDPSSLPDPASTTLAQAQDVANNAYVLANVARATADYAATVLGESGESGEATVSETSATADFTFAAAQPDSNYQAVATPVSKSGSPAADAYIVETMSKSTTKVTLNVRGAPGAGTSVTFDVAVRRNL